MAPMFKMCDLETTRYDGCEQSCAKKEHKTDFDPDEGVDNVVDIRDVGKKRFHFLCFLLFSPDHKKAASLRRRLTALEKKTFAEMHSFLLPERFGVTALHLRHPRTGGRFSRVPSTSRASCRLQWEIEMTANVPSFR